MNTLHIINSMSEQNQYQTLELNINNQINQYNEQMAQDSFLP